MAMGQFLPGASAKTIRSAWFNISNLSCSCLVLATGIVPFGALAFPGMGRAVAWWI